MEPPGLLDRFRSATLRQPVEWGLWAALPLAGMIWIGTRYDHGYFYFDEWKMIGDTRGSWFDMFSGFQGHLEVVSFVIYRVQRTVFGLDNHVLVYGAFMLSLAALHVALALVLRRLGVPTLLALGSATVAVYLGPGVQGMSWEFMLGINFALALSLFAGLLALQRAPTTRRAVAVAALLLLAFACDSGVAAFGAVFVGLVVVLQWSPRLAALTLSIPAFAHVMWFVFGEEQITGAADFSKRFTFANRLFLYSVAALFGGGDVTVTSTGDPTIPVDAAPLGLGVLLLIGGCIAFGIVRRRVSRPVLIAGGAALAAAVVMVVAIGWTRAFLIPTSNIVGSRYVQWCAVFLVVVLVPGLVMTLRSDNHRRNLALGAVGVIVTVGAFVANLGALNEGRDFNEGWSDTSQLAIRRGITVVANECGPVRELNPKGMPSPDLSPQLSVRLLRALLDEGSIPASFGSPATADTRDLVCLRSDASNADNP